MSISNISNIYSRIYTNLISKTTNSNEASETTSSSGTNNQTDILELGSSETDLSAYLNYGASGNYSSLPTLVDYLSSDDEDSDIFGSSQSSSDSIVDLLSSEESDDSSSSIFDSLIETKSKEIDNLISKALEKFGSNETETNNDNIQEEE